ncbi:hypothetical protein COU37_01100 [Candidatus Micrarchaeota archaeon CG10_big_fil_rev_8_21_14_0_10_45_29]|nr:MAG: hypothetical protein COU37_01100 [Candidatus Micrarchaeota archaeon CG10_big_fil_rev_8_21_14_0_10_45_29]
MSVVGYKNGDFKNGKTNGNGSAYAMKIAVKKADKGMDSLELLEQKYVNLLKDKKNGLLKNGELQKRSAAIFAQAQKAVAKGEISENPYTIGKEGEIGIKQGPSFSYLLSSGAFC